MPSPATFIFSLKIILISVGAASISVGLKLSVPLIMGFCLNDVPVFLNSLQMWLKPPYLYLIINGIIITILASSRFNHHHHSYNHPVNASVSSQPAQVPLITVRTPPPDVVAAVVVAEAPAEEEVYAAEEDGSEANVVELKPIVVNGINQVLDADGSDHERVDDDVDDGANDDSWVVAKSNFTPSPEIASPDETQLDLVLPVKEKPLVLSSFGGHQGKPAKTKTRTSTTPEAEGGRAVMVMRRSKPQKQQQQHDTLEDTWKMITEGRHVPPTRQFKKTDTWENHGRDVVLVNYLDLDLSPPPPPPQQVLKSATFRDRTNYQHHDVPTMPPAKIIKEPSLSQDELNHRVEAFIKKFNEEMKLQRQESLNQYMEMINRGAY